MKMTTASTENLPLYLNPVALRTIKTLWSFGCSECNRVNINGNTIIGGKGTNSFLLE